MATTPERTVPQDHGGDLHAATRLFGDREWVDFSASINPMGQPPGLREHVAAHWDAVLHYPDPTALPLRRAVAQRWQVEPSRVVAGNGSAELFELLLRARRPRRLVLCPPDFGLYGWAARHGPPLVEVPRQEASAFLPDLQTLLAAVRPGDLVLFSNPGNPAGTALAPTQLEPLLERCRRDDVLLAIDEAFADFCPEVSLLDSLAPGDPVVVLRSLTKYYAMPGLRAGYAVAPATLAAAMRAEQVPWSVNSLALEAGSFCLAQRAWDGGVLEQVGRLRDGLAAGLGALPGLTPLPSRANYLLVAVAGPTAPANTLYHGLGRRGLLVRHCASFGLGERFLRLAVRPAEDNQHLLRALAELLTPEKDR